MAVPGKRRVNEPTREPDVVTGEGIKELRNRIGFAAGLGRRMTQAELGEVIGMTREHVAKIERGTYPVSEQTRILVLWLMSIYGMPGGRPPHPSIPLVIVPHPPV